MSATLEKFMDVTFFLIQKLLVNSLIRYHFHFEACPKLSLKILRRIALRHDAIFDYANSIPYVICFFNVLGWN